MGLLWLLLVACLHLSQGENYLFFGAAHNNSEIFPLVPLVHDGHLEEVEELHGDEPFALVETGEHQFMLRIRSIASLTFEDHQEEEGNHTDHDDGDGGHDDHEDDHDDAKKKKKKKKKFVRKRRRLFIKKTKNEAEAERDRRRRP